MPSPMNVKSLLNPASNATEMACPTRGLSEPPPSSSPTKTAHTKQTCFAPRAANPDCTTHAKIKTESSMPSSSLFEEPCTLCHPSVAANRVVQQATAAKTNTQSFAKHLTTHLVDHLSPSSDNARILNSMAGNNGLFPKLTGSLDVTNGGKPDELAHISSPYLKTEDEKSGTSAIFHKAPVETSLSGSVAHSDDEEEPSQRNKPCVPAKDTTHIVPNRDSSRLLSPSEAGQRSNKRRKQEHIASDQHEADDETNEVETYKQSTSAPSQPPGTECMNPSCRFRPPPGELEKNFRSCVLDHFGRNKAETVRMKRHVLYCRKCYQHEAYYRNVWPLSKCNLILDVLHFQCLDEGCLSDDADHSDKKEPCSNHCQVRYNVVLRAGEMERLTMLKMKFDNDIQAYIDDADDPQAVLPAYTTEKKRDEIVGIHDEGHSRWKRTSSSFIRAPIQILKDFYEQFCGERKTRAECIAAVEWCKQKFENDECDDLPRFEFVIKCPRIELEIAEARSRKNSAAKKKRKIEELDDEDEATAEME